MVSSMLHFFASKKVAIPINLLFNTINITQCTFQASVHFSFVFSILSALKQPESKCKWSYSWKCICFRGWNPTSCVFTSSIGEHSEHAVLLSWSYGPCMCAQAPVQLGMERGKFIYHPNAAIQTFRQDLTYVPLYFWNCLLNCAYILDII